MSKTYVAVRLDAALVERIDKLAADTEATRTDIIERALKVGLEDEEEFAKAAESPAFGAILEVMTSRPMLTALEKVFGEQADPKRIERFKRIRANAKTKKVAPRTKPA